LEPFETSTHRPESMPCRLPIRPGVATAGYCPSNVPLLPTYNTGAYPAVVLAVPGTGAADWPSSTPPAVVVLNHTLVDW